jgi:hypothetical protein
MTATPDTQQDGFVTLDGEAMYLISDVHRMPPFLVSVVSDADHWMFLSSYGGLTAGRIDEDHCLFPYETDDRLYQAHGITGPFTLLRVTRGSEAPVVWEPFTDDTPPVAVRRNLYKNITGNSVVFEEVHAELELTFRYRWSNSDTYGFVRSCTLHNMGQGPVQVAVLDGLLNTLPAGPNAAMQARFSCLINAYTRADVLPDSTLAVLFLVALTSDKAEPMESLTANTIWCEGLPNAGVLLSTAQVPAFRAGQPLQAEQLLTGRRPAYLVTSSITLAAGATQRWQLVADVDRDQTAVESIYARLRAGGDLSADVQAAVAEGTANLVRLVASADGLQHGGDEVISAHHFANVLFNIMRGGVFQHGYDAPADDFVAFLRARNREVVARHESRLQQLTGTVSCLDLRAWAVEAGDPALQRLTAEYLPLTFSRRHGDPSRPWNRFAIHVKDKAGNRVLNYQGNWRDIFQNWEAMAYSFPEFLDNIIAKFVNATTADGHNPYRVTREGIDWETVDPADPWSHIGYWGDHQIIYLLRLLEASQRFTPGRLTDGLPEACYSYANVPYRILPYAEIVRDPKHTITFDHAREKAIAGCVKAVGADGRLVQGADGQVLHVTLAEKLLVPALAKLSNLVPDAGIWMNTQRPEWNDANNALVGNGISMVTLCYLRRYLGFLADLFSAAGTQEVALSAEVAQWYDDILAVLTRHQGLLASATLNDRDRRTVLNELGEAFSRYREQVYPHGFTGTTTRRISDLVSLCRVAGSYLDHAIRANRRDDGLYHAYNLLQVAPDGDTAVVTHLYEMLEGQVAALSSGLLREGEAADLIDALFNSAILRKDLGAFLLYPNRQLPGFLEKNVVPADAVAGNALLTALLAAGDITVVQRDARGQVRFAPGLHNITYLRTALDALATEPHWAALVATHGTAVQAIYEQVFNHLAFTGRSGTMYGYEGLGCIYWHMEAKLLLAAQEAYEAAVSAGASANSVHGLAERYYRVREGLGFNKSAKVYGAFPTDPYSHTPGHAGAQQPGMTGQVKEEVLTRLGELGVVIADGTLAFRPRLLRKGEFSTAESTATFVGLDDQPFTLNLPRESLAFTVCQVPVVYTLTDGAPGLIVHNTDGSEAAIAGEVLPADLAESIFCRTGQLVRMTVAVPKSHITLD